MITEEEYNIALNTVAKYENMFKEKTIHVSATYSADIRVTMTMRPQAVEEIIEELKEGYGYGNTYNFNEDINYHTLKLKELIISGEEIIL